MKLIENVAKTPEGSLSSKTDHIFGSTKNLYEWTICCLYSLKETETHKKLAQIKENRILKTQEMHKSIAKNQRKIYIDFC